MTFLLAWVRRSQAFSFNVCMRVSTYTCVNVHTHTLVICYSHLYLYACISWDAQMYACLDSWHCLPVCLSVLNRTYEALICSERSFAARSSFPLARTFRTPRSTPNSRIGMDTRSTASSAGASGIVRGRFIFDTAISSHQGCCSRFLHRNQQVQAETCGVLCWPELGPTFRYYD